jgi:flagellar basal body-associated protein FliL
MVFLGLVLTGVMTFFFLFTIIASASYGPNAKEPANIADGLYMLFKPNPYFRLFLWLDIPLIYLIYLFIISLVELLASYATASWYFSRKKKEATVTKIPL